MTIQLSNDARNARMNALISHIGSGAKLTILTGAPPGILQTDTGVELVEMELPEVYFAESSSGQIVKSGNWAAIAEEAGQAGHFSLRKSDGTRCIEGSVSLSGGDMIVNDINVAIGKIITVTGFTLADGNQGQ